MGLDLVFFVLFVGRGIIIDIWNLVYGEWGFYMGFIDGLDGEIFL